MNGPSDAASALAGGQPAPIAAAKRRPEPGLYRKLLWLTVIRLIVVTLLLALATRLIFQSLTDRLGTGEQVFFGVILACYVMSLAYLLFMRKVRRVSRRFALVQVAGDVAFANLTVYLTGGTESLFVFLIPLCILSAANLLSRRGALVTAALAALAFIALTSGLAMHWLPTPILSPGSPGIRRVMGVMTMDVMAILLTGVLGGILAEQLRRAGEALESSEAAYLKLEKVHECIVRSVPSGLLTVDSMGRIHSANPAAARILCVEERKLLGMDAGKLLPRLKECMDAPGKDVGEVEVGTADGKCRWISLLAAPLVSTKPQEGAGFVVTFNDVTEKHALAEAVQRSEKMAAVGRLSAGLAHELRNPLASMSGSVQLLSESSTLDDDDRKLLAIVLKETGRLDALVTDFLRFARPRPLAMADFDLEGTFRSSLSLLMNDARAQRLKVEMDMPSPLMVRADQDQMGQVVWNLLRNALDAMDGREGLVRIRGAKSPGGEVTFSIEDNGVGIDGESLSSLFVPFYTTKRGGTGLGLAIVHGIVQSHGGSISVRSREGDGSTFEVTIPSSPESGIEGMPPPRGENA